MSGECRNIYKICRKAAGITQEAAAERLGISVESIRAYETGVRVPPDDVVGLMSDLYNALHLIAWHVREKNAIYRRVVPEIQPRTVLEASVKINNRFDDFATGNMLRRLLRIAEDNIVDSTEMAEFYAILDSLNEISKAYLELRCVQEVTEGDGV